jgi:hypothetical protein
MIPRYQKVVFVVLLIVSIAMATILVRLRERAHERLLQGQDTAPTTAPVVVPEEQATLVVANDSDGTLTPQQRSLPLPKDSQARARALLDKLLEVYAAPGAQHPVPGVPRAVAQVFLLPIREAQARETQARETQKTRSAATSAGGEVAVVNLAQAFADGHPSGIQTESLTVDSICATLHANLPQIREVRFLVDGERRATLAGHADLTRTYLSSDVGAPADSTTEGAKP